MEISFEVGKIRTELDFLKKEIQAAIDNLNNRMIALENGKK